MKKILNIMLISLIIMSVLSGCSSNKNTFITDNLNSNINSYGIKFLMSESEVIDLLGKEDEKSPCVYGYELSYNDKDIIIGFDNSDKVRKIISKEDDFDIYGIKKGILKEDAIKILNDNEYVEKNNSSEFINSNVSIKLLSDSDNLIRGVYIERIEE